MKGPVKGMDFQVSGPPLRLTTVPSIVDSGPQLLHLQRGDNHTHLLVNLHKCQAYRKFSVIFALIIHLINMH